MRLRNRNSNVQAELLKFVFWELIMKNSSKGSFPAKISLSLSLSIDASPGRFVTKTLGEPFKLVTNFYYFEQLKAIVGKAYHHS
jgi:hypothetical protein